MKITSKFLAKSVPAAAVIQIENIKKGSIKRDEMKWLVMRNTPKYR